MNSPRRLSQAISEGDGISLLVPISDVSTARAAEADGAEGLVVSGELPGLREATSLPVLFLNESGENASCEGADACVLRIGLVGGDWDHLRELHLDAQQRGVEPVVRVRDDEELEEALEHVDPEIFLLSPPPPEDSEHHLENVLDLLPDVPAGKLAIAEVDVLGPEDVVALERAGIDAVIVRAAEVAGFGRPTLDV